MQGTGVILAGGKSSRMGTDKSLLTIYGKSAITHVTEELKKCSSQTTVITNNPASHTFLGIDMYTDRYKDMGPLAGIESGLYHSNSDVCLFAACDMPFIDQSIYHLLYQSLENVDAVIPVYNERMHPLAGIYKKQVLPQVQCLLHHDERKVRTLFKYINVRYVSHYKNIPDQKLEKHFFNMNDPAQYEKSKQL
ncbi:hypothetical protein GCM10008983_22460 [Lentibacillus halophilus]|uniref:Probable molybdenum cofactor guanylyltransferase n=1 Tax=Lentibacillus halophilus TaxID=295065 RepID=A0ABN0ZDV7_9BACI